MRLCWIFCYHGQAVQRQYLLILETKCTLPLPHYTQNLSISWFPIEIGKNYLMDKHSRQPQVAQMTPLKVWVHECFIYKFLTVWTASFHIGRRWRYLKKKNKGSWNVSILGMGKPNLANCITPSFCISLSFDLYLQQA